MPLDPVDNAGTKPHGNPAVQSRLAAFPAQVPGCVPTKDAADDGGGGKEPGIPLVGDEQKQQQVGAAGDGQRDDGRIDDGNQKEPQRPKMHEPARHQRMANARGGNSRRRWCERAHAELDVARKRQAARRLNDIT